MAIAFRILLTMLVVSALGRAALGDSGHQHGGGGAAAVNVSPRVEARIGDQQLVLLFADASPTKGAKLEAVINFLPQELNEAAPGVYLSGPVILGGGRNEIELTYTIGKESGTRRLMLLVPGGATSGTGMLAIEAPAQSIPSWLFALVALSVYAIVFGVFLRRRRHGAIG
jgi:hypothetical protein